MNSRALAYLRWRQDVRQLQAEVLCAYTRWRAAYASYQALAEVFGEAPGSRGSMAALDLAREAVDDFRERWRILETRLKRTIDLGPVR